ncbi:DUF167 domain-containing protein [Solimonas marina]|uniref:UPF0235 protein G7Y82_01985 n=1 Tax=Solimonas marina TaxID=2714601 RepID=A0A970B4W7_9GAMM|nr:DUF167 domain-containing protein [Solimonas marina]NKF21068.1 DUF167 domain-containing protein [Solimonas marina]
MLAVKVSPKASRNAVLGWHGEALKLAVTAAPERGRANAAVQALLAEVLDVPKSAVVLRRGETDSRKQFEIVGLADGEILRRLSAHLA